MLTKFVVSGRAKPKGSMRAFVPKGWKRPIVTASNTNVKEWERDVRAVAQNYSDAYTTGPVRVRLRFFLPRPKSLSSQVTRAHTKRPDIDKLSRAVLDALTGVLWADDSQVCSLTCRKSYALINQAPHVEVSINSYD